MPLFTYKFKPEGRKKMNGVLQKLIKKMAPFMWLGAEVVVDAIYEELSELITRKQAETKLKKKIKKEIENASSGPDPKPEM